MTFFDLEGSFTWVCWSLGVGHDSDIVSQALGQFAPVNKLLLQTAHDSAPGHNAHQEHIAYVELGLLVAVHEVVSVDSLHDDEHHHLLLKLVRILEDNLGEGCTWAGSQRTSFTVPLISPATWQSVGADMSHPQHRANVISLPTDDMTHGGLLRSAAREGFFF